MFRYVKIERPEQTPMSFFAHIGRYLFNTTGDWFGPVDVIGALRLAMSWDTPVATIAWDEVAGIVVTPGDRDLLDEWAYFLDDVAAVDSVEAAVLSNAVSASLRLLFGHGGGLAQCWLAEDGKLEVVLVPKYLPLLEAVEMVRQN